MIEHLGNHGSCFLSACSRLLGNTAPGLLLQRTRCRLVHPLRGRRAVPTESWIFMKLVVGDGTSILLGLYRTAPSYLLSWGRTIAKKSILSMSNVSAHRNPSRRGWIKWVNSKGITVAVSIGRLVPYKIAAGRYQGTARRDLAEREEVQSRRTMSPLLYDLWEVVPLSIFSFLESTRRHRLSTSCNRNL